jgi:hypothetical protein
MPVNAIPIPPEVEEALKEDSIPEEFKILETDEERKVAQKIIPILAKKANELAELNKAKELQKFIEELRGANEVTLKKEIAKIQENSKPPDPKELERLLTQEYQEFKVKILVGVKQVEREFVIHELPQKMEKKFIKEIQKTIGPKLQEAITSQWSGSSVLDNIQRVIDTLPEAMDMMAECCAIALDPYKEEGITAEWVRDNMSSYRIMNVIQAQLTAGRVRDFISAVSRNIPSMGR